MEPNVFRKWDAPSVLVPDKSWEEILDKPDMLDRAEACILAMLEASEDTDLLTRKDTLRILKNVINKVLLNPLATQQGVSTTPLTGTKDTIKVDAFWDEIEGVPENLKRALANIVIMLEAIKVHEPLTDKSTLMDTKDTVNDTVLKPLKGINEDH